MHPFLEEPEQQDIQDKVLETYQLGFGYKKKLFITTFKRPRVTLNP